MISLERNGLIPKVRRLTLHFSFFPPGLNFIYSVLIVYLFLGPILGCTGYPVEFGFTEHSGMIWNHDRRRQLRTGSAHFNEDGKGL